MDLNVLNNLETELKQVERAPRRHDVDKPRTKRDVDKPPKKRDEDENVVVPAPSAATRPKDLLCAEAERQLNDAKADLKFYRLSVRIVSVLDLVFIAAAFLVITQFTLGDVPKSSVTRVIYIIPIAGTLLASGAVAFLMNERRGSKNAVKSLNKEFNRVCKGVLS